MLRKVIHYILGWGVLACVFGAGAVVAIIRGWGSPVVYVDVLNNTDQDLQAIVLEYESCGSKSQIVGAKLPPGGRKRVNLLICGETGYELRVRRADGTELAGGAGYVESGYHVTETVERDWIRTEFNPYHL